MGKYSTRHHTKEEHSEGLFGTNCSDERRLTSEPREIPNTISSTVVPSLNVLLLELEIKEVKRKRGVEMIGPEPERFVVDVKLETESKIISSVLFL